MDSIRQKKKSRADGPGVRWGMEALLPMGQDRRDTGTSVRGQETQRQVGGDRTLEVKLQ